MGLKNVLLSVIGQCCLFEEKTAEVFNFDKTFLELSTFCKGARVDFYCGLHSRLIIIFQGLRLSFPQLALKVRNRSCQDTANGLLRDVIKQP